MVDKKLTRKLKVAAIQHVKEKEFWLNQLKGELTKTSFPYDFNNNIDTKGNQLQNLDFTIKGQLAAKLMKMSNGSNSLLHMILTAGLITLLYKYTKQQDIIIGSPIYRQEIEREFINTVLTLRNQISGDLSFKDLILQVRKTLMDANENQNYPYEVLVEQLKCSSLFDIVCMLRNIHAEKYIEHLQSNMIFSFLQKDQEIECMVKYNANLYAKTTVEQIGIKYLNILKQAFANPNEILEKIEIISPEEKQLLLDDFIRTRRVFPTDVTIHKLFEEQVERTSNKIAVVMGEHKITYQELNQQANQLTQILIAKGVKTGSVVGIMMESSIDLIVGILGILKAGGAYLPVDYEYPISRIVTILDDSQAQFLLTKEKTIRQHSFTTLQSLNNFGIKPVVTSYREPIKDFDQLPKPDRTLIDYSKYFNYIGIAPAKHTVSLQATRGCPFNCLYCHKIWPKKHIVRSAENIFEEIQYCYNAGVCRFVFIDDIFNLDVENSSRLLKLILKNGLDLQLFFSNGLRGDILTKDYIDLMVEAGTVNIDLALESASPRIQKLLKKNVNLERLQENIQYLAQQHPHVILEMEMMHGFPTETEEEAMKTFEFMQSVKWIHFPNLNILKIFPNTEMYQLALENGVSRESIKNSTHLAFHQLPETLPFPKSFTRQFQVKYMKEYFLLKERLLHVLPMQMKILTEDELVQKYDSYLPIDIRSFTDILHFADITWDELGNAKLLKDEQMAAPEFNEKIKKYFPVPELASKTALRVLLLDLSQWFIDESNNMMYDVLGEPLGLMYLLTYLKEQFGSDIVGKIGKSRSEFKSYDQMQSFIKNFQPDVIGIRTLSIYKEFFHKAVSLIGQWGIDVPIIAGGPYATSDYSSMLQDHHVDLAVLGEGEITFTHLIGEIIKNGNKLPAKEVLQNIPGLAFINQEEKESLKRLNREIICFDQISEQLAEQSTENPGSFSQPDDLLYLISTSGSTGQPKSVMLEHRNLVNLLQHEFTQTDIDFTKGVLQFAPIGFDVSFQEIFSTLLSGGNLYLINKDLKKDVGQLFSFIKENKIEVIFWPTAFLKFITAFEEYMQHFPKSVKHIITAGEQLLISDLFKEFLQINQVYLHNHYGPSETHVVTTFTLEPGSSYPIIPPIGKPISNTGIYILSEDMELMPIGVPGELCISGANVGRGYINRPQLTVEKFILNPFKPEEKMYRTGDLARWTPTGDIEFLGRKDHQVKVRGFRIEIGEIESQLQKYPDIYEAAVVIKEDDNGDKYLSAFIVVERELTTSEIRKFLTRQLPEYMIPVYFTNLKQLPLTKNGKIDRQWLREADTVAFIGKTYQAPENRTEEILLKIWKEVLAIKEVFGTGENFFELGGHSLKAMTLLSKVHQELNIKMPLTEVFKRPTVKMMAEYVMAARKSHYAPIEPVEEQDYYPLSSAQKRMYIAHQSNPQSLTYNMPAILVLEGELEVELLTKGLKILIERHESLRTSFLMIQGNPKQKIHAMVNFSLAYSQVNESEVDAKVQAFIRPFDLIQTPLLRAEVVKLAESKHLFMLDMHHIISDGVSMQIIINELLELYKSKNTLKLPQLKAQYKEYTIWQQKMQESEELQRQKQYWLDQFLDEIPVLDLPTDFSRPKVLSYAGSVIKFSVEGEMTEKLNQVAKEHNATLFMILLAAHNLLLYKYSGNSVIVAGVPIAGRSHVNLQGIVGVFINTIAIKNKLEKSQTFQEFLAEVRKNSLNAFNNQNYQFEDLVEQVKIKKDQSRNPLFDTIFMLQNMGNLHELSQIQKNISNLKIYDYEYERNAVKFDLSLSASEVDQQINFRLEYSTKLFKAKTMETFYQDYLDILRRIIDNPQFNLAEIELISAKATANLLDSFNDDLDYEY